MSMMITEGSILPNVATTTPGMPATFMPTKVAELIAIGPGVISAMVTRLANSTAVSQLWISTVWAWMSGMAA